MVEEWLQTFIHSRFPDQNLREMAASAVTGGKRLRCIMWVMMCEAMGKPPKEAEHAACALELAHAASLVKDDVMDNDEMRRGLPSFFKVYGAHMSILAPDVLIPHAQEGVRKMGFGAAWGKNTIGQFLDFPVASFIPSNYEQIIGLKTAPLFETAGTLALGLGRTVGSQTSGKSTGGTAGWRFRFTTTTRT